jgi:hypothetical protein
LARGSYPEYSQYTPLSYTQSHSLFISLNTLVCSLKSLHKPFHHHQKGFGFAKEEEDRNREERGERTKITIPEMRTNRRREE